MATETLNTGKNIIDATQNAVIEAAENVSNIIEEHEHLQQAAHEAFYAGAEFWVAVAFVLTILLLSRPIYKALNGMLNKRIEYISRRLESAAQLQNDAAKLLASYEHKFRNVDKEAEAILKKSQNEIEYLRKASLSRLEQDMAQKEKETAEKLQNAKDKASQEISALAGRLGIKAVRTVLQRNLQDKQQDNLIDASIKRISQL